MRVLPRFGGIAILSKAAMWPEEDHSNLAFLLLHLKINHNLFLAKKANKGVIYWRSCRKTLYFMATLEVLKY